MKVIKGSWAYFPKGSLNPHFLKRKAACVYPDNTVIQEFRDLGDVWAVPRELLTDETMAQLSLPVDRLDPPVPVAFAACTRSVSPQGAKSVRAQRVQAEAIDCLLEAGGGIIELPPGTGKTAVGYQLMQHYAVPTLVVVNTAIIQSQWIKGAVQLMGLPEEKIGSIGGERGKWTWQGKDLVVGMAQSLSRNRDKSLHLSGQFGLAIYDEVHHYQGRSFRHALPICNGVRVGLSATVAMAGRERVFLNHIGRVIYRSEETDLDPMVTIVDVEAQLSALAKRRIFAFDAGVDSERARTINEVAASRINDAITHYIVENQKNGRLQLILSDRIEQLRLLSNRIPNSKVLVGDTDAKKRQDILTTCDTILASASIATEGLDKPELDTLHICLPWSGTRRFIQGLGRIVREHPDKKQPMVFAYNPTDVPLLNRTFRGFERNCIRYAYQIRRTTWKT
jgi:superfamily II DNA or RNA helicase